MKILIPRKLTEYIQDRLIGATSSSIVKLARRVGALTGDNIGKALNSWTHMSYKSNQLPLNAYQWGNWHLLPTSLIANSVQRIDEWYEIVNKAAIPENRVAYK